MSKLRPPLKPLFDEPLSELELQRIWRKVQARGLAGLPRGRVSWQLLAAGCACTLGVVLWSLLAMRDAPLPLLLTLADRTTLISQRSFGGQAGVRLSLSDGSRVQLSDGAVLAVIDNSGPSFATRIQRGRAEFEVKPGGHRRWRVDCGDVSVEVVGTRFWVDRGEQSVRVRVMHGVVSVHGAGVPGGERKLGAGDELYVSTEARVTRASRTTPDPVPLAASQPVAHAAGSGTAPAQRPSAQPALPMLDPVGKLRIPSGTASRVQTRDPLDDQLSNMLRAADTARRAHDYGRARSLLEQIMQLAPAGQHAAVAGITLGRLQMRSRPERAAQALRAALAAAPPAGLREDIMVRLVEAEARAGRADRARAAAAAYEQTFPAGRSLAEVRRWATPP